MRRAALLVLLGVLLNWFPFYQFGTLDGYDAPRAIDRVLYRLQELRLPGVLQRIGVAYLAAALLVRHATTRRVLWTIVALLAGYWLLMTLVPVPGEHTVGAALLDAPTRTLAAWLDRLAFDWSRWGLGNHLWVDTAAYDPEGVLSTLPAIASVLIGVVAGRALDGASSLGRRVPALFAASAALAAAGLAWGLVFPINKPIWTSSYVLFSAGVACAALAASALVAESRRGAPFARIALVFGTNPIVAYVGAALLAVLLDSTIRIRVGGHRRSAHELILGALHAIPWSDRVASLAYSLVFIAICYAGLRVLHRRGVLLRI